MTDTNHRRGPSRCVPTSPPNLPGESAPASQPLIHGGQGKRRDQVEFSERVCAWCIGGFAVLLFALCVL